MLDYLTTFDTEAQYEEFLNGNLVPYINVSYISQTGENKYYKESSALQLQPFTIHVDELPDNREINYRILVGDHNDNGSTPTYYRYKKNNDEWKTVYYDYNYPYLYFNAEFTLKEGDTVQIINKSNFGGVEPFLDVDTSGLKCTVSGNIMSLVWGDDYVYAPANKIPFPNFNTGAWGGNYYEGTQYVYFQFQGNFIVDAGDLWLPTKNLCPNIFKNMFYNCTQLEVAPDVNAKYLPYKACEDMFYNCSSLQDMPNVLAETVERHAMHEMFAMCTTMNTVTDLHIKHIVANNGDGALSETFMGCYSITTCPNWDADLDLVMPENYYYGEPENMTNGFGYAWLMRGMFQGCSSLQSCNWKITLESQWHNGDSSVWFGMFGGIWDDGLQDFRKCNALTSIPILEFKKLNWPDLSVKYPSSICGENGAEKDQNLITSCTVLGVDTEITNDSTMYGFDSTGTFYLSSTSQYLPGGAYENDYPCGLSGWTKAAYVDPNV